MFPFFRVFAVLICFAVSSTGFADPMAISPRVGEEISFQEREYFQLFPLIQNFVSASFDSVEGADSVAFVWNYLEGSRVLPRIQALHIRQVRELRKYIDNYEHIFAGNVAGIEREQVDSLVNSQVFEKPGGKTTRLRLTNNKTPRGRLLFASDRAIGFFPDKNSSEPYRVYSVPAIEQMWMGPSQGIAVRNGAIIGLATGAILAFLVADEEPFFGKATPTIVGGLLGMTVGITAGILIGSSSVSWEIRGNQSVYESHLSEIRNYSAQKFSPPEQLQP